MRRGASISINSPADVATYNLSQLILALYDCADAGSGSASCVGTVQSGALIDTFSASPKTFTVTATDNLGNMSSM